MIDFLVSYPSSARWQTLSINGMSTGEQVTGRGGINNLRKTAVALSGVAGGYSLVQFHSRAASGADPNPIINRLIISAIPEPGTLSVLGLGGLPMLRRRRSA